MLRAPILIAASILLAGTAGASEVSLGQRYVRMRAADAAGDVATANSEMAALMAREPASDALALRAYRQAVASGDFALALKAGRTLDGQHALPPDGPLLFAVEAITRRDWKAAGVEVDRLDQAKLFAFLVPSLRAWIAFGAKSGDPQALLAAGGATPLAPSYQQAQRALLLIAQGKVAEGAEAVRTMPSSGTRLRLLAASALLRERKGEEARALLAGDDDSLAAARARLAAGGRLDLTIDTAGEGVGELLTQAALDFSRQQLAPVGLVLGRLATFAAPHNSSSWIIVANLLGKTHKPEPALAALDHVPPGDPFGGAAEALRVALLIDKGDRQAALRAAQADAHRAGAGALEWGRLGDVLLSAERPGDAAAAYGKAIELAPQQGDLWSLWLQRGAALEQADDWAEAKAALQKALALAPQEPVVLNHLGYSELSRRENVGEAAKLIALASSLRPDDPAITDSLGWAHYVQGDLASAVPLLERAAGDEPSEPAINEHLGDAYWSAGRKREARYSWRAALVTAEDKDAARIRAKLDAGLSPANAAP